MSKVLIIYFSNYGSTKRYAEWIASELNADIYSIEHVNQNTLTSYDTIILGSGLYAGKIEGLNLIVNNYDALHDKKLVLFTCGLADYSKAENINSINTRLEKIIPVYIKEAIRVFYLRGYIDYKNLNLKHRIMMWLMKMSIITKKVESLSEENKDFLQSYGKAIDFTNKNNIMEIVKYCK